MDHIKWIDKQRARRERLGISQEDSAVLAGMSRTHLSRLESHASPVTKKAMRKIEHAFALAAPDALFLLIDYVRIRFKTTDARHIIEDILRIRMKYMAQEPKGAYTYTGRYYHGDIVLYTSWDENKGVLLELKGKGCRQFEAMLRAQGRGWIQFFRRCTDEECVCKRLDLAINDCAGMLDIPMLMRKCDNGECITVFNKFRKYESGAFVKGHQEQNAASMGHTLYVGSFDSEVYFCIYEKDYEQLAKNDIPLEETEVKNRFEIRLKNKHADAAVWDLMCYEDADKVAFEIINRYMRIVDRDDRKSREYWPNNAEWDIFIGQGRGRLRLAQRPKPFDLERILNWIDKQTMGTIKAVRMIDEKNGTNHLEEIYQAKELTSRLKTIVEQQTTDIEDMVIK